MTVCAEIKQKQTQDRKTIFLRHYRFLSQRCCRLSRDRRQLSLRLTPKQSQELLPRRTTRKWLGSSPQVCWNRNRNRRNCAISAQWVHVRGIQTTRKQTEGGFANFRGEESGNLLLRHFLQEFQARKSSLSDSFPESSRTPLSLFGLVCRRYFGYGKKLGGSFPSNPNLPANLRVHYSEG